MPRGKKPYFTPEQDIEIVRSYQAGASLQKIADSYGVSHVPVLAALKRQGVERRVNADYAWQDTPESRAEIIRRWHEDASVKNIARAVQTRDINVSRVLREAGIEARLGGQHHRFTKEQVEVLVREFSNGDSLATLAGRHGGNPITVRGALRRAGVETERKRPKFWTPERVQWLIEQRRTGRTVTSIAEETGYSVAAISMRLRHLSPSPGVHGAEHQSWRGGRTVNGQGYILVTPDPEDVAVCPPMANGYVSEHRLVMAKALGRPLKRTETIHHIDGDHTNNDISNLQLRNGSHGSGVVLACRSCGSHDVVAIPIADPATEEVAEE